MARSKRFHKKTTKEVYGNVLVLTPEGEPFWRVSKRRAESLLRQGLAKEVSDTRFDHEWVLRLCEDFKPSRRTHYDPIFLEVIDNKCVVCGKEENLTRHHVVPYSIRRFFRPENGYLTSYDILAVCFPCHKSYEYFAREFTEQLLLEFNAPSTVKRQTDKNLHFVKRKAIALLHHAEKMPTATRQKHFEVLKKHLNCEEISTEDLEKLSKIDIHPDRESYIGAGLFLATTLKTPQQTDEFTERWRKHFVKTMNPKFLPHNWGVEKRPAGGSLLAHHTEISRSLPKELIAFLEKEQKLD